MHVPIIEDCKVRMCQKTVYHLSFFTGFSISSSIPDYSTICRFRNALLELNIYEELMPEGFPVFADKGYASDKNRGILAGKKFIDGIMHKAYRNKPLNTAQRIINRFISSLRYKPQNSIS